MLIWLNNAAVLLMSCLSEHFCTLVAVASSNHELASCSLPFHKSQLLQGFVHILLEGTWLWFPKLMQNKKAHMWIYELCECLLSPEQHFAGVPTLAG